MISIDFFAYHLHENGWLYKFFVVSIELYKTSEKIRKNMRFIRTRIFRVSSQLLIQIVLQSELTKFFASEVLLRQK